MEDEKILRRKMKDSVFTDLFSDRKYLYQLYRSLHPEAVTVKQEDITSVTLKPILTNAVYNDLGFMVGDRVVILIEAQSTWTENIVVRSLIYLAQTYQEYLDDKNMPQNVYGSHKVTIPKPELYVLYTGKGHHETELTLQNSFFHGEESSVDVKVRILYDGHDRDILCQYVAFTRVYNDVAARMGRTLEAAEEILRICADKDILKEYMETKEREVRNIMLSMFNDEYIQEVTLRDERRRAEARGEARGVAKGMAKGRAEGRAEGMAKGRAEGRAEGMAKGRAEGIAKTAQAFVLIANGGYTVAEIAEKCRISEEEVRNYYAMLNQKPRE